MDQAYRRDLDMNIGIFIVVHESCGRRRNLLLCELSFS